MPYGVRALQKQRGANIAIGCNRNIKHRRFKHGRDVQTKMLSLMHTTSTYNLKVRTAEQGLPSANVNVFLRFHRKGNARSATVTKEKGRAKTDATHCPSLVDFLWLDFFSLLQELWRRKSKPLCSPPQSCR